jgi:hypothetical protein
MKNILYVVIAVLVILLFMQYKGCEQYENGKPDTTIVRDTVYNTHDSVIVRKVKIHSTDTTYIPSAPEYIADTNYAALKKQFEALVKMHTAKNMYMDSLKLDSVGYVVINDTVQFNTLQNRKYHYNYKIPLITETVTINNPPKKTRQLYFGAGVNGSKNYGIETVNAGLLYKTKKDQLYGMQVGINNNGLLVYGVQSYWKIKFKN